MKLFRKIFLQVILGFLVLALSGFSYFIYGSYKQSLESICQYEQNSFSDKISQFTKMLEQNQTFQDNEQLQNSFASYAFGSIFSGNGGLYRSGQELYNRSPYDYDYEDLLDTSALSPEGCGPVLQKSGGRRLLLFTTQIQHGSSYRFQVVYFKDISDIFLRSVRLFWECLLFTLIMLCLVGLLLFSGIRRTLRPLEELKSAAEEIAGGHYDKRIRLPGSSFPPFGQDELSDLAEHFNQMAESIDEHVRALSHINEAQQQLLGSLAHELKTPMTAIIGYADTLLTVRLDDARREKALRYIESECRRLSRLSAKLLELTGLASGRAQICLRPERLENLFGHLEEVTARRLQEKNIRLEWTCTPCDLSLEADTDLMMSLLVNLVDNAFKASAPGSTIYISADKDRLSVRDTGKGIAAEELPRITEPFYMADKSRSRSAGSVGLGLTLCRQIAELHGGRLLAESEEGSGTTISVLWNHYTSVTF